MNFNNCGSYEAQMAGANDYQSASLECETTSDCVVRTNTNLKISPLPGDNFPVNATLQAFNIGGDCNEAGYSNHQIVWSLKYNGNVVRTSGMKVHDKTWNSTCVNGKFRIYVNLSSIGEDPVDRTGLMYGNGTNRAAYELQLEILAQDGSGAWLRNVNQGGVSTVALVPL